MVSAMPALIYHDQGMPKPRPQWYQKTIRYRDALEASDAEYLKHEGKEGQCPVKPALT